MNAIDQYIIDMDARVESLKKYYALYLQESDLKVKADLKDIINHISAGIEADARLFKEELNK